MAASGSTFFFLWEVSLIEWLQSHIGGAGISILSCFSMFGEELLLTLIMGILYWCHDKKLGRTVGLSVMMGMIWNTMCKNIVLRRRPYFDHADHLVLDETGVYPEQARLPEGKYRNLYDYLSDVAGKVPPGANGVIFTPWLHGNRCPFEDSHAGGIFFNLRIGNDKRDMMRAVLKAWMR